MPRVKAGRLHWMNISPVAGFPLTTSVHRRSGTKIVDRILRYENLVAELSEVFSQLKFLTALGVTAKSGYRSDRRRIGSLQ
jgi:hypothetical protein